MKLFEVFQSPDQDTSSFRGAPKQFGSGSQGRLKGSERIKTPREDYSKLPGFDPNNDLHNTWRNVMIKKKDDAIRAGLWPAEQTDLIPKLWNMFHNTQQEQCALTGKKFTSGAGGKSGFQGGNPTQPSLDRIDSTGKYTIDNVQWIILEVNWLKRHMSNDKFIELCKAVASHSK